MLVRSERWIVKHWMTLAVLVVGVIGYLDLRARVDGPVHPPPRHDGNSQRADLEQSEANDSGLARSVIDGGMGGLPQDTDGTRPPEAWLCDGEFAPGAVQQAAGTFGQQVFTCATRGQVERPDLHGLVSLYLRVGADGRVLEAHVSGIADPAFRSCVGQSALTWTFAPLDHGACAVASMPFMIPRPR